MMNFAFIFLIDIYFSVLICFPICTSDNELDSQCSKFSQTPSILSFVRIERVVFHIFFFFWFTSCWHVLNDPVFVLFRFVSGLAQDNGSVETKHLVLFKIMASYWIIHTNRFLGNTKQVLTSFNVFWWAKESFSNAIQFYTSLQGWNTTPTETQFRVKKIRWNKTDVNRPTTKNYTWKALQWE